MDTPLIGFVGLGKMGNAMVQNLLKKGFTVHVFNRTKEKEKEAIAAGAKSQESLQQLVHNSSIIITMLTDDAAVREVFTSGEGLLSHSPSGKIFIDMSTVTPSTSRKIAELCKDSRNDFVDAPVSGSIKPASEGELLLLAGGDNSTMDKVRPVLDALGRRTFHLGPNGAGTSAKVALNYYLSINLVAIAEMVVLGEKQGVAPADMLAILNDSSLASPFTKMKANNIVNDNYSPAFALKDMVKDLTLIKDVTGESAVYASVFEAFLEAGEDGFADNDCVAIYKSLRKQAGLEND